ncbi:ABC transporter permease [Aeromicrobium sp. CFBP 8757]|uniref:ABC transporter permease n=1 Tax=Aeromicrobium sp. CFBP 8757 TaxID=2775288 RepID=UPI00178202DF|nr:ABC transporter permease [Aeromicrobium sp. CFBP 8757]MBD8605535.1 ABC transporter permease [Aeromicrobium sp. CFBP 8757]
MSAATTTARRAAALTPGWRSHVLRGSVLLFVLVMLAGTLTTDGFYSVSNLKAVLNSAAIVGIVAIGATAIVIGGQLFSLSIGTTVAVSAMAFLYFLRFGLVPAVVLTIVLSAVLVGLQGYVVGRLGANAIIVTIGAGALQEGGATWVTGGVSVYPPADAPDFSFLAKPLLGVPLPVYVFIALAVLGQWLLVRTTSGRQLVLMGENPRAARAGALPITRLTVVAFAAAGVTAGVAGVLLGAFNQSGTLGATGTLTYDSIAAVLVGGSAVTGGRGSVVRSAVGAVLIAAIADMLLLRGYSTPVQVAVLGFIVGCVILVNHLNSNQRTRA